MKISGTFDNTSFKFNPDSIPDIIKNKCDNFELFNQSDLLFLEEKYMIEAKYFSKITDKFSIKKFDSNLKLYKQGNIISVDDFSSEARLYKKIITDNSIDGIKKKELNISIEHFSLYEKEQKVIFIQHIYILLMISNITNFNKNIFEFIVKLDDTEVQKKIDFTSIESLDLLKFYNWIMSSEENVFTRLSIVREIIINKNSFTLDDSDLDSAKSAFNRVIKEEIDKYFEQVNILKNDFLLLSERKQESYNSLHLKFLGWCSAIAIFIYDSLKDQPNEHLFYKIFLLSNEKINLFLSIFIVSLIIIWIIFIKEMNDYSKEHSKIKEFYTKQLFFEDKDFQNYLPEPITPKLYIAIFICILILLLIRLFLIN